MSPSIVVRIIAILAKRSHLPRAGGKRPLQAKVLIEREDEVDRRGHLCLRTYRERILPRASDEAAQPISAPVLNRWTPSARETINSRMNCSYLQLPSKGMSLRGRTFTLCRTFASLTCHLRRKNSHGLLLHAPFLVVRVSRLLPNLVGGMTRDKISLDYTLLPYVAALIEDDKIDPAIAVALLRLSDPVELYSCGTEQLAELIEKKCYSNSKKLMAELIFAFEQNNPGRFHAQYSRSAQQNSGAGMGKQSEQASYLLAAAPSTSARNEENECRNQHGLQNFGLGPRDDTDTDGSQALKRLQDKTDPEMKGCSRVRLRRWMEYSAFIT